MKAINNPYKGHDKNGYLDSYTVSARKKLLKGYNKRYISVYCTALTVHFDFTSITSNAEPRIVKPKEFTPEV